MEALLDPRICEIPRPGKKPLFTSGSLPQPSTSIQNECLTPILSLVENTLFIWNNWFVSLPPSLLSADLEKPYDAPNAGELFVHQDFNEYRVLAKDERHRSRRLNNQQLSQLRNYGRFDIESRDFPGYHHSWHISKGLQKGRVPALNSLKSVRLHILFKFYSRSFRTCAKPWNFWLLDRKIVLSVITSVQKLLSLLLLISYKPS